MDGGGDDVGGEDGGVGSDDLDQMPGTAPSASPDAPFAAIGEHDRLRGEGSVLWGSDASGCERSALPGESGDAKRDQSERPSRFRGAAATLRFRETLCAKDTTPTTGENILLTPSPSLLSLVFNSGQGDYYSAVPPPEEEGSLWSWLTGEDDEPRRGESANFNNEDEDTFTVRFFSSYLP